MANKDDDVGLLRRGIPVNAYLYPLLAIYPANSEWSYLMLGPANPILGNPSSPCLPQRLYSLTAGGDFDSFIDGCVLEGFQAD